MGTVSIIVKLQPMLKNHAAISRKQRTGLLRQSSRIHVTMLKTASIKVFFQQFREWCLTRRGHDWFRPTWLCVQSLQPF